MTTRVRRTMLDPAQIVRWVRTDLELSGCTCAAVDVEVTEQRIGAGRLMHLGIAHDDGCPLVPPAAGPAA